MIAFAPSQWVGLDTIGAEEFAALRPPAEKAVLKAALHLERAIKKKLTGARTGRIYRSRGRTHQASAPGEPPALVTGQLRNSITHTMPVWHGDNVSAEVGTSLDKAARLEFGGVDSRGVRILPRPYIGATMLEEQDTMETIMEESAKGPPAKGGSSGRQRDALGRFI